MVFRDMGFKKCYSSDEDNVLFDFYLPVLKRAIRYDRLAGFFSSTSLAIAAQGIVNLILNGGKMRLVASPRLNNSDIATLINANKNPEKFIEDVLLKDIEDIEKDFIKDHVRALGWMIANKRLDLKIAILYDDYGNLLSADQIEEKGIFHQKVGILYDNDENIVSFSGSINETAAAWLDNIEEFKVFKSWNDLEKEYIQPDIDKFNRIWNGHAKRVKIVDAPEAILKKMVERAPKDINSINWDKYNRQLKKKKLELFDHQKDAVDKWLNNGKCGLFEMATGTGKTLTALGCFEKVTELYDKWIAIIASPQSHLSKQWEREIEKFGIEYENRIISDSTNIKWKDHLADCLLDIRLGYTRNVLILTTHRTLSSKVFTRLIKENKKDTPVLLIADEVHGLGTKKRQVGLLEEYEMKLGLSATPKRWFDDLGTEQLYTYFNRCVYQFGLEKALNTTNPATGKTYLTPYRYIPKFISLNSLELQEYIKKTAIIIKMLAASEKREDKEANMDNLIFARANIVKNAFEKYAVLQKIIAKLGKDIAATILFCSPQQIDEVMRILSTNYIRAHRFTEEEGTHIESKYGNMSERDYLLKNFSNGTYQVLAALKCLDEGVDVPNARTAVLMASSTNPREYIQRIGRVIRRSPNKDEATIYDMIVVPSFDKLPPAWIDVEKRIFEKELTRALEIASNAVNNAEVLDMMYDAKNRLR